METMHALAAGAGALAMGAGVLAVTKPKSSDARDRFEIRFPSEVTETQVRAVLAGIAGMRRASQVDLETVVSVERIRYFVTLDSRDVAMFRGHLRGVMPGARLDEAEPADGTDRHVVALDVVGSHLLLSTGGESELVATLLGVVSEVISGEQATYRWQLSPGHAPRLSEAPGKKKGSVPADQVKVLRKKYQGTLLRGQVSVEVEGRFEGAALEVAERIAAIVRGRIIRGSINVRGDSALDRAYRALSNHRPPVYSAEELVGLVGWPVGSPEIPTLQLGTAPQLMPESGIPDQGEGRLIGTSTWPGMKDRKVIQPAEGSLSHTLTVGPTGTGKSTLLTEMAADDMRQNRGLLLIDMKGDTAQDLLARVPEHRVDDVIVLDPAENVAVPGLKVLGGSDPELVADQLLATFKGIFSDSWGVRSDQYLRLGFTTLASERSATLADLGFLFTNQAYRSKLVAGIDDPMLKAAWASFEQLKPGEQAQHLASPLRKVDEVVGRRIVRLVLAQPEPRFDMSEVLAKDRIVIVSLSPGRLGAPAASLIGALVVFEIYKAVLARQALPQHARQPFGVYIDEPKVLTQGSPLPLDSAFELFRSLGVGITLAAQSVSQLGRDLQRAVLANAASLIAFRQSRGDAELLAKELPGVNAEALQHLLRFEAVARIGTGHGQVARPATVKSPAPSEPMVDPTEIRERSAELFGADPVEVDRLLRERHGTGQQVETGQVFGRARRRS